MASVRVYVVSTVSSTWTGSAGGDQNLLIDEPDPANEADYIMCGADGKLAVFRLGQCPPTKHSITSLTARMRIEGSTSAEEPAIRVEVRLNNGVIASYEGSVATGGVYKTLVFSVTGLNILRNDYNAGSPEIWLLSKNGDPGYPDWIEEA